MHVSDWNGTRTDVLCVVFRREPLWKVSMNVRVNTSVRCTFDAEEHVLRIVLAETVESPEIPAEQWPREIVVYALKV